MINNDPIICIDYRKFYELRDFFFEWNKEIAQQNARLAISKGFSDLVQLANYYDNKENDTAFEVFDSVEFKLPFEKFVFELDVDELVITLQVEQQSDGQIQLSVLDYSPAELDIDGFTSYILIPRVAPLYKESYYIRHMVKHRKKGLTSDGVEIIFSYIDAFVYAMFFFSICKDDMVEVIQPVSKKKKVNPNKKNKKRNITKYRRVIIPQIRNCSKNEVSERRYFECVHRVKPSSFLYVKTEWKREGCWCTNKKGTHFYRNGGMCKRKAQSQNIELVLKPNRIKGKKA